MAWLSRLVAGFLVAALCLAITTTVFDHTLFNSHYLEQKAAQNNAYARLSTALSAEVAKNGGQDNPQVAAQLQQILTPAVLQTKINGALDQIQAYYKGNGPSPVIDLTDLSTKAQAAGLTIPADSPLNKPITLSSNTQAKGISKRFERVKQESIIAVLVALVVLMLPSWKRYRYAILPDIAIECGLLIGIDAVVLYSLPSVVNRYAKINFNSNTFGSLTHDMITVIAHDLGKTFGIIAMVLLGGGLTIRTILARTKSKATTTTPLARQTKPAKGRKLNPS